MPGCIARAGGRGSTGRSSSTGSVGPSSGAEPAPEQPKRQHRKRAAPDAFAHEESRGDQQHRGSERPLVALDRHGTAFQLHFVFVHKSNSFQGYFAHLSGPGQQSCVKPAPSLRDLAQPPLVELGLDDVARCILDVLDAAALLRGHRENRALRASDAHGANPHFCRKLLGDGHCVFLQFLAVRDQHQRPLAAF